MLQSAIQRRSIDLLFVWNAIYHINIRETIDQGWIRPLSDKDGTKFGDDVPIKIEDSLTKIQVSKSSPNKQDHDAKR
ncbi:hypothetical protein L1987_00094 [Smallanthus sonchifolius]|uniref:Uncharacterized protein n=1 Tax=Smallanthus sonchifolius TaxID=185202 RepID=A0ACB9K1B9_9ASTR|nr:hypothetical protein L1987_00094 [Smallanthus sonchifolius]